MSRILTRGLWLVVVLLCVGLVAWHVLAPGTSVEATPTATVDPSAAAEPFKGLGADGKVPDSAALTDTVKQEISGKTGSYRLAIDDVLTGESLVDVDASEAGTPASSLKLLTGTAALATFSLDHTFATTATLSSSGQVHLVGGGDGLLGEGASDSTVVNGRAGLKTLAEETVKALVAAGESGKHAVGVDGSLFYADKAAASAEHLNSDWSADLVTTNNITDVETPALYAGRSSASPTAAVVRHPASKALSVFVDALNAAAKDADGMLTFTNAGTVEGDDAAKQLASVQSATVLEQLQYMEKHSDNFMAETYGRLVSVARNGAGSGTPAQAAEAVTDTVKDLGVDVTGLHMQDTSGLAASNKVTPATLAQVLRVTQTNERGNLRELAELLPIAGVSGTLAGRLTTDSTRALVRAKTGTLAAVVSLSGYVTTADGRLLSFSIMANDVQGALAEARGVTDSIAAKLVACGCQAG